MQRIQLHQPEPNEVMQLLKIVTQNENLMYLN